MHLLPSLSLEVFFRLINDDSELSISYSIMRPGRDDAENASSINGHCRPSDPTPSTYTENIPQRTLADIRNQVALEAAVRLDSKAEVLDDVRVGVALYMSKNDDEQFLRQVAYKLDHRMLLRPYLFAIGTTGAPPSSPSSFAASPTTLNTLVICGSSEDFVQRAILLTSSKFLGRVEMAYNEQTLWLAIVRDIGTSSYDQTALWDVVRKSARNPIDPLSPPPGSRSIDEMLSDARAQLQRITPQQAFDELHRPEVDAPTFLVDIRPAAQREASGMIHGSLIIERNVLEWRFDPRSSSRLAIADRYDLRVIVFCEEGYTSSLAALALHQLGLLTATDIIGGYQAWKQAGLPVDVRRFDSDGGSQ